MARNARRPPAPDPIDELRQLALDLDLTALADALPHLLARAEKEALSFTDFGLALLRAELSARRTRHADRDPSVEPDQEVGRRHLDPIAGRHTR